MSILNGDSQVVFAAAWDGSRLTLPEEQSVLMLCGDRNLDHFLAGVTWVRKQLPGQLDVATLARKLRLPTDDHAYIVIHIAIVVIDSLIT